MVSRSFAKIFFSMTNGRTGSVVESLSFATPDIPALRPPPNTRLLAFFAPALDNPLNRNIRSYIKP